LLSFECCNPLWGRTSNPYLQDYTSGGSSGGEGALLALDGSALGFGTDVGGSLRIPASYCGLYSFKPGHGRIPFGGVTCKRVSSVIEKCSDDHFTATFGGNKAIRTVAGPIGRSVKDLVTALKVLSGSSGVDSEVAPLPYREVKLPVKLKFGYYIDGG
jgi:Asp-tRNA(Asn)/Glu-tRNA(Gln) amidotransferase A subunit family amidase